MEKKFIIIGTNDKLWNYRELVTYLAKNQRKRIELKIRPEAVDLNDLGIYDLLDNFSFEQVNIYTENLLEHHDTYSIINPWNNQWLAHQACIPVELHQWNQKKLFLAFFHRPTASRLGMAAYLHKHHPAQSHIHFPYETDVDSMQLFEFDKLAQYDKKSLANVADMLPMMPLRVFENTNLDQLRITFTHEYNNDHGIQMYSDIFVDIVSESHVHGNTFYPTEKTARPVWLKKPFIVFASKDYLDYLHQIGFKTFCDFWSEDYDGYEGRERYIRILKLIDDLASKSTKELNQMYQDMQPILNHNYTLLCNQSYGKIITKIV